MTPSRTPNTVAVRAEAFRHSAFVPLHRPDASGARCNHDEWPVFRLCEGKKKNAPGVDRGRSLASGDRGDRSPVCRRSIDGIGFVALAAQRWRGRAQAVAEWPQRAQPGGVVEVRHDRRDRKTLTRERRPRTLRRCNCGCNDRSSVRERPRRLDDRAQRNNGASAGHTWSRSFGCTFATGCRLSAWKALRSVAIGSSRNGSSATSCCFASAV